MRCAEFYVCLTTPIYFTRASPPPRQEERDANQTCWLDCDHDRIGWHRGCGGWLLPPRSRRGVVPPRPPPPPSPPRPGSLMARPRIVVGPRPNDPPPPVHTTGPPAGGGPPPRPE